MFFMIWGYFRAAAISLVQKNHEKLLSCEQPWAGEE